MMNRERCDDWCLATEHWVQRVSSIAVASKRQTIDAARVYALLDPAACHYITGKAGTPKLSMIRTVRNDGQATWELGPFIFRFLLLTLAIFHPLLTFCHVGRPIGYRETAGCPTVQSILLSHQVHMDTIASMSRSSTFLVSSVS